MENNQSIQNAKNMVKSGKVKQYIVVRLGHEEYGINIEYVQNIVRMTRVTRVPKAPYFIKGVINLRGEIIPIMSVRLKFGLEADEYTNTTRIIIIKVEGNAIGLLVDQVKEVIPLTEDDIEKVAKDVNDEKAAYVSGVGKTDEGIITLLNIKGFIISE